VPVKLYYCYAPADEVLVDKYFLPSIKDDYELKANFTEIQGTGRYRDGGTTGIRLLYSPI